MTSALVTGAAGFLGSNLVDELLGADYDVVGVDNLSTGRSINLREARTSRRFRFVRSDLTRTHALARAERYFHLASPASPPAYQRQPIQTLRVNAEGTYRVLEAARRFDARVLLASTSEVYGDPEQHPQGEEYWGHVNPIGPRSCYDEGKRYAEALASSYRRQYGLDVRIARIFNTYGPRMDPKDGRVVSNFIVQALRGRRLTVYGRGEQTRSFCYISDLIRGLRLLMDARPSIVGTPVNLGNPREFTIRELVDLVARAAGVRVQIEFRPLPEDDPQRRSPNIARAQKLLRWSPRVSLEDGLTETVRYFRERLHIPPPRGR